jgi:hypothetical protein
MQPRESIKCHLHSNLDAQWRELLNIYFARDSRVEWVDRENADFVVLIFADLVAKPAEFFKNTNFIVLSFGDLPKAMVGLRPEDKVFRDATRVAGAKFFYFQAEPEPQCAKDQVGDAFTAASMYALDGLYTDQHITILTLPLGYCSGSKINLFYKDNDTSAYHITNCRANDKKYEFDWCWIGAASSKDRRAMFEQLQAVNGKHQFIVNPLCTIPKKQDRAKFLHADNKPVPYAKYLDMHRKSKVCISANGIGMWNYKDAEFLANDCFVLRQWHKNLGLNPLTPKDGEHWAVFQTDQVAEAIDFYVHDDVERERICDAGHDYFKWAINGGWASEYAGMFMDYLNGKPKPFERVEYVQPNSR